ncbi:LsmAD domain-containing protein [Syncephalis plumigaleata]|nr:LsmAD domain-containing protein [Syncephalis plumigaleata]
MSTNTRSGGGGGTGGGGGRNRHGGYSAGANRNSGGGNTGHSHNHNNHNNNSGGNNMNKSKWHSQGPNSPTDRPIQNKEKDAHMMHQHDRALFLLMHLVGTRVKVTVRGGAQYEGLFHAAATESELGVVLKMATRLPGSSNSNKNKSNGANTTATDKADNENDDNTAPVHTLVILSKDLIQMDAANVDFTVPAASTVPLPIKPKSPATEGFKTDTAITGKKGEVRERTLRKWADYSDDEELAELGDWGVPDTSTSSQPWDQFEANKKLFGLKSDYNEEIYTTKLDRNKPDYKEREKAAIKIANEILRSTTDNVHVAEERNQVTAAEDNMDEEDRYGAVLRAAKGPVPGALGSGGKGKYQPPQARAKLLLQQQQQSPQQSTSSNNTVPLVIKANNNNNQSASSTASTLPKQTHPLVEKAVHRTSTNTTTTTTTTLLLLLPLVLVVLVVPLHRVVIVN